MVLVLGLFYSYSSNAELNEYGWDCDANPTVSSCSYNNNQWHNGIPDQKNISDDGWVGIPLEFGFPFYGETFTYSWMHSNGVISFLTTNGRPTIGGMCCNGVDLENNTHTYYSGLDYFIAPLWTDLININKDVDGDGINDNGFFVESYSDNNGNESQRYLWQNVSEFYNTNPADFNTFSVELFDTGKIDMHHFNVDIINHNTWIGVVGDQSVGEIDTSEYATAAEDLIWNSYQNTYSAIPEYDPCNSNPLSSTSCTGYEQAYYNQQCTINPLYDAGCPGYASAYYNQQCTADPLYHSGCPGYDTAYYNQQCSLDPLYDSGCTGYAAAYYDQQCSLDPLYDQGCDGYAAAYYLQQCTANPLYDTGCEGYETAYIESQCEIDPLYSPTCTGYAAAYAELQNSNTEEEEEVVVVEETYDDGTFSVSDVLEETSYEVEIDTTPAVVEVVVIEAPVVVVEEPIEEEVSVTASIFEEPTTETQAEPVVEVVYEEETLEEALEEEIAEETVVEETVEEETEEIEVASVEEETDEEEEVQESGGDVEESVDDDGGDGDEVSDEGSEDKDDKKAKKDSKKSKQKSKREKLKEIAQQKATELANKMSEVATIEQQQAIQAQVLALIGYVPGFNEYRAPVIDLPKDEFYQDKGMSENRRGLRNGLAQQILHEKMVNMQYER